MQNPKDPLRVALNLRIGDKLAAEIDRIAGLNGKTASETARTLLAYGVEVARRLEAQRLMQHHEHEYDDEVAGRIVISAELVPYTWSEVARMKTEMHDYIAGEGPPTRPPTWDDLTP